MRRFRATLVLILLSALAATRSGGSEIVFSDAQLLAVTVCPDLLAPDSLVQGIATDLDVIRERYPQVASIHFQACEYYQPGAVSLRLTADAMAEFLAGEHEELNALHAQLGTPEIRPPWYGFVDLFFNLPYNPDVLPSLYYEIRGVTYAEHIFRCSGDGNGITIRGDGAYRFRRAWGENCLDGCEFSHVWIIAVGDGQAHLLEEYGDDVEPALRETWGSIKARFR